MITDLEKINLKRHTNRSGSEQADGDYAEAFGRYGIGVTVLPVAEAAGLIRGRAIHQRLAMALDDWAVSARFVGRADRGNRLLAVARAADPDPWRNRLRDAIESNDRAAMLDLARQAPVAELTPTTVNLLGYLLNSRKAIMEAAALLEAGRRLHPDDFWLNHDLAWSLTFMDPPRLEDAVRYYTAAIALRPTEAAVHMELAVALARKGALEEARAATRPGA
jgi:serine/threonine-protein kinase